MKNLDLRDTELSKTQTMDTLECFGGKLFCNYEQWKRIYECIAEKCAFLSVCGGGCPQGAMIASHSDDGGKKRFVKKASFH